MNELEIFIGAPAGRRLLVYGVSADSAVRAAAEVANLTLVESNAREMPVDEIVDQLEQLSGALEPVVVLISGLEHLVNTRADWRIRGTTQFARHLGLVLAVRNSKTLRWITDPRNAFAGRLSMHSLRRPTGTEGKRLHPQR